MMAMTCESSIVSPLFLSRICQAKTDPTRAFLLENKFSTITVTASPRQVVSAARLCNPNLATKVVVPWRRSRKGKKTTGKKEHHLWKSRDSAQSGQKALALVRTHCHDLIFYHPVYSKLDFVRQLRIMEVQMNVEKLVYKLPNEKEAVYGALDKWTAWETEFPVIAVSKA
ncbi:hypothetical protein JHK85_037739 [Glycine max]|nr:hypothetical protein JHK85_037739 [Glycine max]